MSSLIHSPKGGSTAAKLKGFGHALNKSFGIAKRWTLEKVGAKEQSTEPPEVTALISAFQQDKVDLEELRAKVAHLVTVSSLTHPNTHALPYHHTPHTLHTALLTSLLPPPSCLPSLSD